MSIILTCVCVIIIAFLVHLTRKTRNERFYQLIEQFPTHPSYYPLLGNAHLLAGSLEGLLKKKEKLMESYDRLLYWLGPVPILLLKKCDDIAAVLNQCVEREDLGIMKEWMGTGMLNAEVEEWKKSRRVIGPAFNSDMLSKYGKIFNEKAADLVENLRPAAENGEEVDVLDFLRHANLDSVVGTSMGISIGDYGKEGEKFSYSVMETMKQGTKRIQYPWLIQHHIYMIYLKLTGKLQDIAHLQYLPSKIIRDKMNSIRKSREKNDSGDEDHVPESMIDLITRESSRELGFDEIRMRDELLLMAAGGVETTALGVSFLMLMLAMHQDAQQKAYEEIVELTQDRDFLTENEMNGHFKFLEKCIKETLRMFSPVMVTTRRTTKEVVLKDEKIIPANLFVVAFIYLSNRDPDTFENPDKWDPENFSEQALEKRSKNSQLNFGVGPRSCIGYKYAMMSLTAQIVYVLRYYHLTTSIKEFTKDNLKTDLCIRSKIGYPIKLTPRSPAKR
ncbi:cytochrome P450 4C1-like [Planococcus citri]|uniref:cytochrome P450 4C1-like n=1 Tax=Planococcus citri TaxID=170843 RepID=UPI0031F7FF73